MINDRRVVSFLRSLEKDEDELLKDMEDYAINNNVPIIRKEVVSFLRVLIEIKHPVEILELGTAIGYSAIVMANAAAGSGFNITTVENYPPRIAEAKINIEKSGYKDRIQLIESEASEFINDLDDDIKYDFIFIDAAKGQYGEYLKGLMGHIKDEGIVLCDNILKDGEITESRFGVERRNRTIHTRMRDFLYDIKNMEEFDTTVIPIGDGMSLSVYKGVSNE